MNKLNKTLTRLLFSILVTIIIVLFAFVMSFIFDKVTKYVAHEFIGVILIIILIGYIYSQTKVEDTE